MYNSPPHLGLQNSGKKFLCIVRTNILKFVVDKFKLDITFKNFLLDLMC